jgi:formylglycine-generating enzyme required for sulfatase activity
MERSQQSRDSRLRIPCVGLLAVLVLILIIASMRGGVALFFPIPASRYQQASAGIRRNSEWRPLIRRLNGMNMTLVPVGCFEMGSTDRQLAVAFDSCDRFYGAKKCPYDFSKIEQPSHKVCFEQPYWMGVTEITNFQYGSSSSTNLIAMYRSPSWPRETVTWAQAAQYCLERGARLPSESEWEYAARGPDNLIYPWGNDFNPDFLISGTLSPGAAGMKRQGGSWVGAFDLSGEVEEWVADWYAPYNGESETNPTGPMDGEQKIARGGSWFSFAPFMVRAAQRLSYQPDYASSVVGFRCARDFE